MCSALGACPLYPRKRTCAAQLGMSALCQKRTLRYLFDHLISPPDQSVGDVDAERLGGFEIDHQLTQMAPLAESLSVRVFILGRFFSQPESLQSRGLLSNNLCLDFVVHAEIVIFPCSLLQPRLHSRILILAAMVRLFSGTQGLTGVRCNPFVFLRRLLVQSKRS